GLLISFIRPDTCEFTECAQIDSPNCRHQPLLRPERRVPLLIAGQPPKALLSRTTPFPPQPPQPRSTANARPARDSRICSGPPRPQTPRRAPADVRMRLTKH